jgi:hypothetical protein
MKTLADAPFPHQPSSPFVSQGGELRLSNPGQRELLRAVAERGAALCTTVRGFSMSPFICDEDVLTIAPPVSPFAASRPCRCTAPSACALRPR